MIIPLRRIVVLLAALIIALRLIFPVPMQYINGGTDWQNPDYPATFVQTVAIVVVAGAVFFAFPGSRKQREAKTDEKGGPRP